MKGYKQLTREQRYQIEACLSTGLRRVEIARRLGVHRSTVWREVKRNGSACTSKGWSYTAARAQTRTEQRRVNKGRLSRKIQGQLRSLVELKLQLGWSPQQICGRLRLEKGIQLSHETVYQHVLRDCHERHGPLRYFLRFGGYKHHRCRKSRWKRPPKRHVSDRPVSATNRSRRGHWERDLMASTHGGTSLLAIVDRHSRYLRVEWVPRKTEEDVTRATHRALGVYRNLNRSVTNDNGSEFRRAHELERKLDAPVFYTEPSAPWQRGSVENTIGLMRQYVPKGREVSKRDAWLANALEETLNFRPRKTLGYRTPHEKFFQEKIELCEGKLMQLGLKFSPQS